MLYDRTGQRAIYRYRSVRRRRRWGRSAPPQYFLDATVAIEDASFYDNPGFDLEGMGRALWYNMADGQLQGRSTSRSSWCATC